MDYNRYYDEQSRGLKAFTGSLYQKGSGVGSFFRKMAKYILPLVSKAVIPMIDRGINYVKDESLNGLNKFSEDISNNSDIKASASKRLNETLENIVKKVQTGGNKKKKINYKNYCIFD
jgi:hypothetical protein